MKKLFTLIASVVLISSVLAQSPEKMSYQAVVRDASDNLVTSQSIGLQISILQGSQSGTAVYVERHFPTTNINGLITVEIGNGTIVQGDISTIDWANGPYFIKTETDLNGGANYTISGTSQILSAPYALYAKSADSIAGTITEADPIYNLSVASGISESDTINWNNKLDNEIDSSVTNELQVLSISNDTLYLSNGGEVFMGGYLDNTDSWTNVGDTIIYNLKKVGVGTQEPTTNLEVFGGTKFGQSGLLFTDLFELQGLTESTGDKTFIELPEGWTSDNTRILTAELKNKNDTYWNGLGAATGEYEFSYHLDPNQIKIYYIDTDAFHSTLYRIVMIRVK